MSISYSKSQCHKNQLVLHPSGDTLAGEFSPSSPADLDFNVNNGSEWCEAGAISIIQLLSCMYCKSLFSSLSSCLDHEFLGG